MRYPVRGNAENFANRVKDTTGNMPVVYEDTDAMLAAEDLDGADICTPHCYHHINAIKCLNAGVNVIVEKPIGITIKATRAIIEAANANGRIAATAENIRRAPSRRTAWWLMNEKKCSATSPCSSPSTQATTLPTRGVPGIGALI